MTEQIKLMLGVENLGGPRNIVMDGGCDPLWHGRLVGSFIHCAAQEQDHDGIVILLALEFWGTQVMLSSTGFPIFHNDGREIQCGLR